MSENEGHVVEPFSVIWAIHSSWPNAQPNAADREQQPLASTIRPVAGEVASPPMPAPAPDRGYPRSLPTTRHRDRDRDLDERRDDDQTQADEAVPERRWRGDGTVHAVESATLVRPCCHAL